MSNVINKQSLKQLDTQLKILEGNRIALRNQVDDIQKQLSLNKQQITKINITIFDLKTKVDKEIEVSEHAILRYLERVIGMDIEAIKDKICTKELKSMVEILGNNGTYPVDNFRVKMKDSTIVTILN